MNVWIDYSTLAADSSSYAGCYTGSDQPDPYAVTGRVLGLAAGDGFVYMDYDEAEVSAAASSYRFDVEAGVYDLIATRYAEGFADALAPDKLVIQRGVSVETDQTLELDFEGAEAFTPRLKR